MTQNPYDPQAAASPVSGGYFPGQVPGVPGAPAQRLVAMEEEPEEKMIEAALRPKSLDDFVGQRRVRQQLSLVLRDRFGFTGHLEFYSVEELELVLRRSAGLMDMQITSEGFTEIAGRSRGTPRIANRLLRRVRDWALVNGVARINARDAATALDMYEVDSRGLDRLDRAVLESLIHKFGGGPVGLSTLAIAVGEETETVETVAEPYLVREGLIGRTPRGRVALPAAWEHLGLEAPEIQL